MRDRLPEESSGSTPPVSLDGLLSLFYEDSGTLARFARIESKEAPADYQRLLAHASHMTVTVEALPFSTSPAYPAIPSVIATVQQVA